MNYTDKQIEDLSKRIYEGSIDPSTDLPEDLYMAIGNYLENALYKGYGNAINDFAFGGTDQVLLDTLRNNIYMFSGAKTYQQCREMADLAAKAKNFKEFRDEARKVYEQYNVNWLKSEYNTAIGQADQAAQWNDIEADKELFPFLRYVAVMDKNTSEICRPLDNVTLPVDHPLWGKYSPLNHFNCRCILEKIDKYEKIKQTSEAKVKSVIKELNENVDPAFKMNPGKDGYIFSPEHPYFQVAAKDKAFAKRNFDLPIPPAPVKAPLVKSSSDIIEHKADVKKYFDNVATKDQKDALSIYTGISYKTINDLLRDKLPITNSKLSKRITDLTSLLKKAPKFTGEAYRGMNFSAEKYELFMKRMIKGNDFKDLGFMSSSFSKTAAFDVGDNGVEFIIKSKNGVCVEDYSQIKKEKEILFNRGSKFKIEDVRIEDKFGIKKAIIKLTEL
jgi:SPP1 gp7 family putative phage head morphogenesis protein